MLEENRSSIFPDVRNLSVLHYLPLRDVESELLLKILFNCFYMKYANHEITVCGEFYLNENYWIIQMTIVTIMCIALGIVILEIIKSESTSYIIVYKQ